MILWLKLGFYLAKWLSNNCKHGKITVQTHCILSKRQFLYTAPKMQSYYLTVRQLQVITDQTNTLQYKDLIQGQAIVWVWSNDSSKPLQPIVTTFHDDKTLITFQNTTGQTQYISKGVKVTILDMQLKDGGMTNFKWDIPTDDEGNLVLYAHTFASTLEPTKLANKDPLLQADTKIEVSEKPK